MSNPLITLTAILEKANVRLLVNIQTYQCLTGGDSYYTLMSDIVERGRKYLNGEIPEDVSQLDKMLNIETLANHIADEPGLLAVLELVCNAKYFDYELVNGLIRTINLGVTKLQRVAKMKLTRGTKDIIDTLITIVLQNPNIPASEQALFMMAKLSEGQLEELTNLIIPHRK